MLNRFYLYFIQLFVVSVSRFFRVIVYGDNVLQILNLWCLAS